MFKKEETEQLIGMRWGILEDSQKKEDREAH